MEKKYTMNYELEHIKEISEKLKSMPKIENTKRKITKKCHYSS